MDLARLRGVKYFTWEKLDKLNQQDDVSVCSVLVFWSSTTCLKKSPNAHYRKNTLVELFDAYNSTFRMI